MRSIRLSSIVLYDICGSTAHNCFVWTINMRAVSRGININSNAVWRVGKSEISVTRGRRISAALFAVSTRKLNYVLSALSQKTRGRKNRILIGARDRNTGDLFFLSAVLGSHTPTPRVYRFVLHDNISNTFTVHAAQYWFWPISYGFGGKLLERRQISREFPIRTIAVSIHNTRFIARI